MMRRNPDIDERGPGATVTITDAELVCASPGLTPRFESLLAEAAGRTGFAFVRHAIPLGEAPSGFRSRERLR